MVWSGKGIEGVTSGCNEMCSASVAFETMAGIKTGVGVSGEIVSDGSIDGETESMGSVSDVVEGKAGIGVVTEVVASKEEVNTGSVGGETESVGSASDSVESMVVDESEILRRRRRGLGRRGV